MAAKHQATTQPSGLSKHDKDYGTPVAGSKTEARGILAHERISREILELCCVIEDNGTRRRIENNNKSDISYNPESTKEQPCSKDSVNEHFVTVIEFKKLFDIYTYISNKLVGVLLRARKYGILDFQGETLFQKRDDAVVITLLYSPSEVRERLKEKTFSWGKCM